MKKLLLTGAMLLALSFNSTAQETIFNVDFSSIEDQLEDWYLINADGDQYSWGVDEVGGLDGFDGGIAFSASYINNVGALTPDNSLITQAFEVPENGFTLSFKVGANTNYPEEHYAVYVVNDAELLAVIDGFEDETTTTEDYLALLGDSIFEETLESGSPVTNTVSFEEYAGESVRLVFRHYDVTDMFYLFLDDVVVTANTPAATENNQANFLSLSPNPATSVVNVANPGLINNIKVADLNGRVVKSAAFDGVDAAQVNIEDLASGVYMITVASDKGTTTKKIIKN